MNKRTMLWISGLMLGLGILGGCRSSAMAPSGQNKEPLPQVFVVGDSISMHYGPYLEQFLSGKMRYARKQRNRTKRHNTDFSNPKTAAIRAKFLNISDINSVSPNFILIIFL